MKLLILGLGGQEILLIAILALLFFGGKKIPELMGGLGKGVKTFRDAMDGKTPEQSEAKGETKEETKSDNKDDAKA